MARPGIMVYFDIKFALEIMTDEQAGMLFKAFLKYGEYGEEPEFDDSCLKMAWAFMKPRSDRDEKTYNLKCLQKKYAVYCRECKKRGEEYLSYSDWKDLVVMQQCMED